MSARAILLPLAALLVLLLLLAPAACVRTSTSGASPPPVEPASLRVVTWNIHHGRGLDDVVDVARLARQLEALRPDVVFLQEVDVGVRRSGGVDIPTELAQRLGMHAAFGKNIDYQGGDYGNAILSRLPLRGVDNLHYRMLREGEQRGVLQAEVQVGARPLRLWNTHIDWRPDDAERLQNVAELRDLLRAPAGGDAPVVLAGDFNDLPDSAVHALLCEDFVDAFLAVAAGDERSGDGYSFPADAPRKRIDWVLTSDAERVAPRAARVMPTVASDHAPVVVDFDLRQY